MTNRIMYRIQIMGRWLQSSPPANSGHKLLRIALYVLILTIAFGLRMQLAAIAYPAQMDSTHMIHQGILWAQGEPGALSTIWQEAPVLTAGIATGLGYNCRSSPMEHSPLRNHSSRHDHVADPTLCLAILPRGLPALGPPVIPLY